MATIIIEALDAEKVDVNIGNLSDFTFNVTRSDDVGASSVEWEVSALGSITPIDFYGIWNAFLGYYFPHGKVEFANGETVKVLSIKVKGDYRPEEQEDFLVTLSNPVNATLGSPSTATGSVLNDDIRQIWLNNAKSRLDAPLLNTDYSFFISPADAAKFTLATDQFLKVTVKAGDSIEIWKITSIVSNELIGTRQYSSVVDLEFITTQPPDGKYGDVFAAVLAEDLQRFQDNDISFAEDIFDLQRAITYMGKYKSFAALSADLSGWGIDLTGYYAIVDPEDGSRAIKYEFDSTSGWLRSSLWQGETSDTAYRGDRGKTAYDHSQVVTGNPHAVTKSDVGLGNVANVDTTNAANISSGVLDIARIPAAAIERLASSPADQTARYALTTATVQNGDMVKQLDTGELWIVVDDANLSNSSGWVVFTAQTASAVPWSGITSKPANLTEIAAATYTNDDFIQKKGGVLTNRTIAQVVADLFNSAVNALGGLTAKSTPIDADLMLTGDSAASYYSKKTTFLESWDNYFKAKADALYGRLATAGSWSALQTFNNGMIKILGTSTGGITLESANTGASNHTATFKAESGTVAYLTDVSSAGAGHVVKQSYAQTSAMTTGSTAIPLDDTIPQNTEGFEVLTASITPSDANDYLIIEANVLVGSNAVSWVTLALFRDSTANAIRATTCYMAVGGEAQPLSIRARVLAGSTSATTFKLRVGSHNSTMLTINGIGDSNRKFGNVADTSMLITEVNP